MTRGNAPRMLPRRGNCSVPSRRAVASSSGEPRKIFAASESTHVPASSPGSRETTCLCCIERPMPGASQLRGIGRRPVECELRHLDRQMVSDGRPPESRAARNPGSFAHAAHARYPGAGWCRLHAMISTQSRTSSRPTSASTLFAARSNGWSAKPSSSCRRSGKKRKALAPAHWSRSRSLPVATSASTNAGTSRMTETL